MLAVCSNLLSVVPDSFKWQLKHHMLKNTFSVQTALYFQCAALYLTLSLGCGTTGGFASGKAIAGASGVRIG